MFRQLLGLFGTFSTVRAIGLAVSGKPQTLITKAVYHGLAAGARMERDRETKRPSDARPPRRYSS
jgi:hypothetical protein